MNLINWKSAMVVSALALGGVSLATVVSAHGPGGKGGHGPDFATMDADGDGAVSGAELMAMRQGRFDGIDGNGDGFVTSDEIMAHMETMQSDRMARRADRMMERADEDGDGRLSMDEMLAMGPGRGMGRLDENGLPLGFDADGDGLITADEFEAGIQDRRDHRRQGRHGGHGGRF